jgi:SAM-dependent methyltransferase
METLAPLIFTSKGFPKTNPFPGKRVLHIGCGDDKLPGATGVDSLKLPAVDVVHNLDSTPWPFADNAFDVIYAHSVVEHLSDIVAFMEEVWRVLAPGGRIIISVPYFRSPDAFTDITHKHFFTSQSFDYFLNEDNTRANYAYTSRRFRRAGFWFGWPAASKRPLVRIFKRFIGRRPKLYDTYLSLLAPVKHLVWEMEPIKP